MIGLVFDAAIVINCYIAVSTDVTSSVAFAVESVHYRRSTLGETYPREKKRG